MIFIVMTLRNLLMPLILLDFMNDVWTLSPPSRVLMDSVNLRHILRWSSPTTSCNTTVLYSVRYQGEFELLFMNNSWLEAARCQKIPGSECDLSLDLGTDADYVLQVRAECGSQLSNWAKVPFNRRNTILQVPEMMVTTMDDALQVSIIKPSVSASVTVWEKDDEPQAVVYMMAAEQKDLHVAALQEGEEYCVKAQLVLNPGAHSGYTETRCVSITGPGAPAWKEPTTVILTIIIMLGLLIGLFWSIIHCHPESWQMFFQKEPLPQSLKGNWDTQVFVGPEEEAELCEETPTLLVEKT
ncbi:interleukin-20 receptor subunit beta isoform X1 [Nothobranchius furzeri]|uniref:Cytokine receptor family member B16 n=1 Tax=Nothobranchius furzeri TaxID=105023 RepID=A0A8C6PDM0_NOTFU|nr:cytokine receptor family member B16 isoform X1 [Nothobranchius furzeri]KAF7221870.1 transcript variant X1 [Nothobranchius furzeri]